MIRGLDSDETVFLDMVSQQQQEIANRRFNEESQEIREYRVWVMLLAISIPFIRSFVHPFLSSIHFLVCSFILFNCLFVHKWQYQKALILYIFSFSPRMQFLSFRVQ